MPVARPIMHGELNWRSVTDICGAQVTLVACCKSSTH